MKTLIYFNRPDCPTNIGISQLTDDVQQFLADRSEILINTHITGNILEFENTDGIKGYAILIQTPANFEN